MPAVLRIGRRYRRGAPALFLSRGPRAALIGRKMPSGRGSGDIIASCAMPFLAAACSKAMTRCDAADDILATFSFRARRDMACRTVYARHKKHCSMA